MQCRCHGLAALATLVIGFDGVCRWHTDNLDVRFFQAGKGILLAIGKGILSAITLPFRLIKKAFGWIARLLPFSDAQEGPLSKLSAAGRAIITTLCKGILAVAKLPLRPRWTLSVRPRSSVTVKSRSGPQPAVSVKRTSVSLTRPD